jgi:RNA polymerase sigma-70 factor (ECF subfamily)
MAASAEFVTQITRVQRQLHAFILSVVWDMAEADDVLQETNLVLWQKADEFDPTRNFLPWAMQFAKLQTMAYLKRRKRAPIAFDDNLLEELANRSIITSRQFDTRRAALADCIQKLSTDHRTLIATRYEPDCSVNDLAATRQTTPSALSQMLRRIRQTLLDCVEKTLAQEARA